MPKTLVVLCNRCGKTLRTEKRFKRWVRFRWMGRMYRQRAAVYCSMGCAE